MMTRRNFLLGSTSLVAAAAIPHPSCVDVARDEDVAHIVMLGNPGVSLFMLDLLEHVRLKAIEVTGIHNLMLGHVGELSGFRFHGAE